MSRGGFEDADASLSQHEVRLKVEMGICGCSVVAERLEVEPRRDRIVDKRRFEEATKASAGNEQKGWE